MKIILTGSTGFIGSEVLSLALAHPGITSIVALSRRPLPSASHPKLRVVVMSDFLEYSPEVLEALEGAEGGIWCMGTTKANRELEVEYPRAFGQAMSSILGEREGNGERKFRYVHLSGGMTERDQERSLWFKGDMRRMKGEAETNMLALTGARWQTTVVKAAYVVSKEGGALRDAVGWIWGDKRVIGVDVLAAFLLGVVLGEQGKGEEGIGETVSDNAVMVRRGREVLEEMKG